MLLVLFLATTTSKTGCGLDYLVFSKENDDDNSHWNILYDLMYNGRLNPMS
jgi:hypothetical protein